jgi:ABC-type uncharacterized transport system substrate-binding protein
VLSVERQVDRGEKNMKKKVNVLSLSVMLFALCVSASAQQPKKVPRIGYLTAGSLSAISARIEAFRQGLRELGYVEGKNIVVEWRSVEGKPTSYLVLQLN